MSVDEIKKILNSLIELPAMPNVVTKALSIIKDPNSGAKDLAKVISNDHSITVELLKMVNSPLYNLSQNVQTVDQSIALLGFNEVKSIVIACAMKPMMTSQCGKDIWEHSINTAVAAETIAKKLGRRDYDELFAQGLMHDLGKMVFELYNSKKMTEAIMLARGGADTLVAEKMVFGFDHTEVGSLLGKRWELPKQIISIMTHHHKPQASEFKTTACIIYLANRIVQDPSPLVIVEPEVAPHLDFEITNVTGFRRQVLDKARLLLRNLNSL